MASDTLAYLYQLQNADYQSLSAQKFKVAVVDDDSARLSGSQVAALESSGKTLISYISIGEAEDYRGYWQPSWDTNPPSFLLGENPDWEGNYNVKFWDPAWQNIIIGRAVEMAREGYSGICMDVVDCYNVDSVKNAYNGPTSTRAEMIKFIGKISDATKAINPDFKIIQNNGHDLLVVNPDDPNSATNTAYLAKIDGVNAETTFYMPDNAPASWSAWNAAYLKHAVDAGLPVFAIDYPSSESTQVKFIDAAIAKGFIPFVGNQELSTIDSTNYQVLDKLPANAFNWLDGNGGGEEPPPPPLPEINEIVGTSASDLLNGTDGKDKIFGQFGNDTLQGYAGNDSLHGENGSDRLFSGDGSDALSGGGGSDSLYGGTGGDHLEGDAGSDRLEGGSGNDILQGGTGNDTLTGDSGNDHLYGGSGYDKFVVLRGTGQDVIHDFSNPGRLSGDTIQISADIHATKAQILGSIEYQNGNAIIHLDGDNAITVTGIASGALTESDFAIL